VQRLYNCEPREAISGDMGVPLVVIPVHEVPRLAGPIGPRIKVGVTNDRQSRVLRGTIPPMRSFLAERGISFLAMALVLETNSLSKS
jgi:hypothetical protein